MKKYRNQIIVIWISFLLISCKGDKDYETETTHVIITGECSFFDVFKGTVVSMDNIEIKIKSLCEDAILPSGLTNDTIGDSFLFGPLYPGIYELAAEYNDEENNIFYVARDTVTAISKSDLIVHDLVLIPAENSQFIKGKIQFRNLLSNKLEDARNLTIANIEAVDSYVELPNNGESLLVAPEYMFGPLINQTYLLNFQYIDEFGLKYSKKDSIVMDGSDPTKIENYTLDMELNTILIAQVVDSLMNGMSNVNVYLYNNYSFLKKYRANSEAAVATGLTNSDGEVVFTNLTESKYFVYGERTISSDTLSTYDPDFESSEQVNLVVNDVNYQQVIIK